MRALERRLLFLVSVRQRTGAMSTGNQQNVSEPTGEQTYLALKTEISKRLRHVCEAMPDAEFDELVGTMARLELKYRKRDGRP